MGCPCGCLIPDECVTRKPIRLIEDWPDYSNQGHLHTGQCSPAVCGWRP